MGLGIYMLLCVLESLKGCKLLHIEWITRKSYCIAQGTKFNIL